MLKVLIADDEEKICQLIIKLINWEEMGLKMRQLLLMVLRR